MNKDWLALIAPGLLLDYKKVEQIAAVMPVMAIGDIYSLVPNAVAMYASDGAWWDYHHGRIKDQGFKGTLYTQEAATSSKYHDVTWVEWKEEFPGRLPPKGFTTGYSSGEHGLVVAYNELEAKNILLYGFEYGAAGDGHYFGNHPAAVARPSDWHRMAQHLTQTGARLANVGVHVINCTEVTALEGFERVALQTALDEIKGHTAKTRRTTKAGS